MRTNTSVNIYPTTVNLKEMGPDGDSFHYIRSNGELNERLTDLIGGHDYDVQLTLRPMGNVFEIAGEITTTMDLLCAHCGREMSMPIRDSFNEIIVVMSERPRAGHSGHTGGSDDGPFCNYVTSYVFDLAEFVREHVATTEPYTPLCARTDCEDVYKKAQVTGSPLAVDSNPFAALKDLKAKED